MGHQKATATQTYKYYKIWKRDETWNTKKSAGMGQKQLTSFSLRFLFFVSCLSVFLCICSQDLNVENLNRLNVEP